MSIQDYIQDSEGVSNIGGNKPFHTYGFADEARARQMGSNGFRSFKDRRKRELNRRLIHNYTESKVVKVPEARQELAVAQREDTKQRLEKMQSRREDYGASRSPTPTQRPGRPGQVS